MAKILNLKSEGTIKKNSYESVDEKSHLRLCLEKLQKTEFREKRVKGLGTKPNFTLRAPRQTLGLAQLGLSHWWHAKRGLSDVPFTDSNTPALSPPFDGKEALTSFRVSFNHAISSGWAASSSEFPKLAWGNRKFNLRQKVANAFGPAFILPQRNKTMTVSKCIYIYYLVPRLVYRGQMCKIFDKCIATWHIDNP